MNMLTITTAVKTAAKTGFFFVKKFSPEICLVAGIASAAYATYEFVKAAQKAEKDILEPAKAEFEKIEASNLSDNERKKQRRGVYKKTFVRGVKLYGKALCVWCLAMTCLISGFKIQHNRMTGYAAAANAASVALQEYRQNVIDEYGPEVDEHLMYDKVVANMNDEVKKAKADGYSDPYRSYKSENKLNDGVGYFAVVDEDTVDPAFWYKDPVSLFDALWAAQCVANQKLQNLPMTSGGVLELNDILDSIGLAHGKDTVNKGWKHGDVVDFGLQKLYEIRHSGKDVAYNLLYDGDGCQRIWFLNFNCRENVWDI